MAERTAEQTAGQTAGDGAGQTAGDGLGQTAGDGAGQPAEEARGPMQLPEQPAPPVSDGALIALLAFDGLLLGAFGLMFTPLYTNGIPVPMGALLSILVLPWLIRQAGELDVRPALAGAPLTAWVVAVGVLGLVGPGGDSMLLPNWQSLLLVAGGIGAGLWSLRATLEREYRRRDGG